MAISKRRRKYYLIILITALLLGLIIPFAIDKFRSTEEPVYYYPHDSDRQNYLDNKSEEK
jgi:hypothetical protein